MNRIQKLKHHLELALSIYQTITHKTVPHFLTHLIYAATLDHDGDALKLYAKIARDISIDIEAGARLNQHCNGWIDWELGVRLGQLTREWGES
jgi:hypothetical protein